MQYEPKFCVSKEGRVVSRLLRRPNTPATRTFQTKSGDSLRSNQPASKTSAYLSNYAVPSGSKLAVKLLLDVRSNLHTQHLTQLSQPRAHILINPPAQSSLRPSRPRSSRSPLCKLRSPFAGAEMSEMWGGSVDAQQLIPSVGSLPRPTCRRSSQ